MIGTLTGKITHKNEKFIIVDVGGVGYQVNTVADTVLNTKIGDELYLFTYLAVRENALDLYGFTTKEELDFFHLLIGVSGIGPKSALTILSVAPPPILKQAVGSGDTSYLTKVSGIGRKNAEKIILELKDKLGSLEQDDKGVGQDSDIFEALEALGFTSRDAREVLKRIPSEIKNTNERIKEAIKILGQQK